MGTRAWFGSATGGLVGGWLSRDPQPHSDNPSTNQSISINITRTMLQVLSVMLRFQDAQTFWNSRFREIELPQTYLLGYPSSLKPGSGKLQSKRHSDIIIELPHHIDRDTNQVEWITCPTCHSICKRSPRDTCMYLHVCTYTHTYTKCDIADDSGQSSPSHVLSRRNPSKYLPGQPGRGRPCACSRRSREHSSGALCMPTCTLPTVGVATARPAQP